MLDSLGYARFRHRRVYGEEALAVREAALWLAGESHTLKHASEPLARYDVHVAADTGKPGEVGRPRLFETSLARPRPRLFGLDCLGKAGWLNAMRLEGCAPRAPRGHNAIPPPRPKRSSIQDAAYKFPRTLHYFCELR